VDALSHVRKACGLLARYPPTKPRSPKLWAILRLSPPAAHSWGAAPTSPPING